MNIRFLLSWACAAALCLGAAPVAAQEAGGQPAAPGPERAYKPMPVSPEKSARLTVHRMDSLLGLTDKQRDRLYKLHLKWAREDMESQSSVMRPPTGGRPGLRPGGGEGMPPSRGGRGAGRPGGGPGGGDFDRRPPEGFSGGPGMKDLAGQREKMEKTRQKREKKLRKALTDEQYVRWTEERRSLLPSGPRPGDRRPDAGGNPPSEKNL